MNQILIQCLETLNEGDVPYPLTLYLGYHILIGFITLEQTHPGQGDSEKIVISGI